MGMHSGVVASRVPLDRLIEEFDAVGIGLRRVGDVASSDAIPEGNEESYVIGGERGGATYLFDESMLLSAGRADDLAAIANRTGELVVGCGAETSSQTYYFSAFEGARLLRLFWMCHSDLTKPFSDGAPLASEASEPLDGDFYGGGIFAALRGLGFDYEGWEKQGPFRLYIIDRYEVSAEQPLELASMVHCERHQIPAEDRPAPIVSMQPAPEPSLWAGLVRWFRRFF